MSKPNQRKSAFLVHASPIKKKQMKQILMKKK